MTSATPLSRVRVRCVETTHRGERWCATHDWYWPRGAFCNGTDAGPSRREVASAMKNLPADLRRQQQRAEKEKG